MAAHGAAATTNPSSGMPSLPTPERTGAAFSFPYAQPYSIQLDLMTSLFEAIEQRKVAVFESPTGTGKSLSLICGTFTWLRANAKRMEQLHERGDEGSDGQPGGVYAGGSVEPAWVRKQDSERRRRDAMRAEDELKERIAVISRKEAELKRKAKEEEDRQVSSFGRKKSRINNNGQTRYDLSDDDDDGDDEAFLPSTASEPRPSWHSLSDATPAVAGDGDSNLSPAVRALMVQLSTSHSSSGNPIDLNDELPETTPKIIYVSRTHSQLSQFVEELRKTDFGRDVVVTDYSNALVAEDNDNAARPARVIALGSRTQMCIHEKVKAIGEKKGAEAMNEACRDLITAGAKTRCDFMPPMDNAGRSRMLDFRDRAMAKVRDIEDLVTMGKEMGTCPYYAARTSARQAELITLPYPLLLNKTARETLDISLRDSVVLVDESHNLIDTILAVHTVTVSSTQIKTATSQIEEYLNRFGGRLRGESEVMLRTLRRLLGGLEKVCEKWAQQARSKPPSPSRGAGSQPTAEEVWTAAKVVSEMGGNLDTINFAQLERFLKDGQIARKVSSYADREKKREDAAKKKEEEKAAAVQGRGKKSSASTSGASTNGASTSSTSTNGASSNESSDSSDSTNQSAISSMHSIEAFIFSLSNSTQDGRVLLTLTPGKSSSSSTSSSSPNTPAATPPTVQLKYQLLNPSEAFHPIISQARAVIMAGGTMEPTNTLRLQLVSTLPPTRWHTFSCGHIVPPTNLLCRVVPQGPRGFAFDFRHATRSDMGMLDDLGNALCNLANLVPQGMVVFLTSYKYLDDVVARWKAQGIWKRLEARKRIFTEPRKTEEVEGVLEEYKAAIKAVKTNPTSTVTGSLLLAVVGAKLSEGINFSDYLARAVIMVGMPYPNMYSPELKERQRYVREMTKVAVNRGIIPPLPAGVDAGNELYTNLCMKSINQSIGRAIRHQGDWAALLLLDGRYSKPDTIGRLPGWIRGETKVVKGGFGGVVRELGAFVREKKSGLLLWPVEKEEEEEKGKKE